MLNTISLKYPLVNRLNSHTASLWHKFFLVCLGNILLVVGANLYIPLVPVPVTMQTFAVLFIGMVFGWRLGALTITLYLVEGLIGLPVFAQHIAGWMVFQGTTGGYLIGFLLAGLVVGFLSERGLGCSRIGVILLGILGMIIIYSAGVIVLSRFVGLTEAIAMGVMPFLLIDAVKILLLAFTVPVFWRKSSQ